uniref:SWI/SNF-related matrix-associated actin-dependent regulator of chromatin subfamily A-like protein 1 n=1 Tax=Cuerna arida TaxID=1464854 RepID=A0A1B6GXP5_9HEMI
MEQNLTPEQKARIELNRKLALEKRAARLAAHTSYSPVQGSTTGGSLGGSSNLSSGLQVTPRINTKLPDTSTLTHFSTTCNKPFSRNVSNLSDSVSVTNKCNSPSKEHPQQASSTYQHFSNSPSNANTNYPPLDVNYSKSTNSIKNSNSAQSSIKIDVNSIYVQSKPINPICGVCRLISKERFTVDVPFHQPTIDLFRSIKGKEYDSKTRLWTFPVSEYFNLKKSVGILKPHVVIGDLPKCVVETFITKVKNYQQDINKVDISRVDENLLNTIYPFQMEGIKFGVSRGGRCLIADDMGLGKSIQALGIADYYRSDWPLLIVCPSSMRFQWEEELRVRLPNSVPLHRIFVMTSGKDFVDGAQVLILSYDLLSKKRDIIKKMGFGVIILDESHCIKSMKTQRGKTALEMTQQCKRVILLSGTPVLSRPAELYTQIRAVDLSAFPYFKEYGMRYCAGVQSRFGWDFSGSSNMEELKILLETRFMIRRLKSNVLTQLPSKIRQVIVLNSKSLSKSSQSMDAFALKLQSSSLKGSERHGTLLSYFSETAKTKSNAVCEYIVDVLQDNRKFLCFAHHAEMLDAICNTLEQNQTFYIRIDGSVTAEDRKLLCDKFQYEDKWKVAVLSIKAANTGLTLTAAQMVIFAELFWNPGDLAQAEDRAHRIGQEDCVVIKYLIAKGTADDYLWPLIQSKLEILNKAGLSKDSYISADTKCIGTPDSKSSTQTKIDDFFENPFDDEDDSDLLQVMDEIDGVQEKKIKLDC